MDIAEEKKHELRNKIQAKALDALVTNNGGTCVLHTGTGKSKVAIDYAKKIEAKNILITSPRETLKETWSAELVKWGIDTAVVNVTIENIQTCYKWDIVKLNTFDLIIADEVHTAATHEYGKMFMKALILKIKVVGLTGTPDDSKREKKAFYATYCPIVYRYLDSAKDGVINKRKYIIYEHNLTDDDRVVVKVGQRQWTSGEHKQYEYIKQRLLDAEEAIVLQLKIPLVAEIAALTAEEDKTPIVEGMLDIAKQKLLDLNDEDRRVNYFALSKAWKASTNANKKMAAWKYGYAINNRKELLWNLTSTRELARKMANYILEADENNKVLVFSERTKQAMSISNVTCQSKQKTSVNKQNLSDFDQGAIRQLGSCYSLTLGLNLKNAGYAINESYNGSSVQFKQKNGRVDRLPVTEDAIVVFIVVKDTQTERWFNNAVVFDDDDIHETVTTLDEFKETFNEFKNEKA